MSFVPLYAVDIETDTKPCHDPKRPCCENRGLDPFGTTITEIVVKGDGVSVVLDDSEGEVNMLKRFADLMWTLPTGIVVTWNGHVFDGPFLDTRFIETGLISPLEMVYDPSIFVKYAPLPGHLGGYRTTYGPHEHVDICHYYRPIAEQLGIRHRLKPVAEAVLGVKPIEVDRENMHLLTPEERNEYVTSDGTITHGLARYIPEDVFGTLVDSLTVAQAA